MFVKQIGVSLKQLGKVIRLQSALKMLLNEEGENLQVILDRVLKNSRKMIVPKMDHADEIGYFAIIVALLISSIQLTVASWFRETILVPLNVHATVIMIIVSKPFHRAVSSVLHQLLSKGTTNV